MIALLLAVALASGRTGNGADDTVVASATGPAPPAGQTIAFDQQMQAMLGHVGANEERWREQLQAKASLWVGAVDSACSLTDRQRVKLEAATRLDIGPVWDEVDAIRARYAGRTIDLQKQENHSEWGRFHQDMARIQGMLAGAEGDPQVLHAVIATILDEDQRSRWQRESAERDRVQWRAVVDEAMASFDVQLGLTSRQHDALRRLLLDQSVRLDPRKAWQQGPQGLPMICWHVLGRIDQDRLKDLVSERQWPILAAVIQQGRGQVHLKQQKIILD